VTQHNRSYTPHFHVIVKGPRERRDIVVLDQEEAIITATRERTVELTTKLVACNKECLGMAHKGK
jgi:hypothetical protein